MRTTDLFLIDGSPMLVPDGDMSLTVTDLEASDSGRDESGVLHRFVVRHGVGSWLLSYTRLTQEEYRYMESLFAGKNTFQFTYPSATDGTPCTVTACRTKHDILWQSAAKGLFRGYQFRIVAC